MIIFATFIRLYIYINIYIYIFIVIKYSHHIEPMTPVSHSGVKKNNVVAKNTEVTLVWMRQSDSGTPSQTFMSN